MPRETLPEPRPSAHVYGETDAFGGSVPVAGIAGDQQAALYGQACHTPGLGKNTYGTGSFVLQNAGTSRPDPEEGLLTTVAWGVDGRVDYALEAAIFVTGAGVQWLRDGLGIIDSAARDRGAGALAGLQRRRLPRARLHRARLAALGPLRARHDRRAHARVGARASGARDARGDGLPDRRCRARDGGGVGGSRSTELKADGGARAQLVADALPGRRAGGARWWCRRCRRRPRWVRPTWPVWPPGCGASRTRATCGGRPRATSHGWATDEREALLADWARALERSRGWARNEPSETG